MKDCESSDINDVTGPVITHFLHFMWVALNCKKLLCSALPLPDVTILHSPTESGVSRGFVCHHRDGIPPTDLASFSCLVAEVSLPATERVFTVLATAGLLSPISASSPKLKRPV
jgi:hypothetical protein